MATARPSSAPLPIREDCWSEEATTTLIDAWGERYLELNRGNLRQTHWQEVADVVNSRHGHDNRKSLRTDIQCKNRIDTLKKRYKIEKARVSESEDGCYVSTWPFFVRLDCLIRATCKPTLPVTGGLRKTKTVASPWIMFSSVPVAPRSATQKRPSLAPTPTVFGDANFRRNFSAIAAAAAEENEGELKRYSEDSEDSRSRSRTRSRSRSKDRGGEEVEYSGLAQAIERFVDVYERVEVSKQRQMIELEKQRMQFAKDLEFQRMQLQMETQLQLEKIKRAKRTSGAGSEDDDFDTLVVK